MNKTTKQNTLVSIFVVAAVAVGFFFLFHRKVSAPARPVQSAALDWTAKIPDIQAALLKTFPASDVGSRESISITDQEDVTGDGVPEALVDMGSGGASADNMTLVQMVDGQVRVAQLKNQDGTVAPVELPQGDASLHSDAVGLASAQNVLYHGNVMYSPDGTLGSCTVEVYRWNPATGIFEYDVNGSQGLQQQFCSTMSEQTN